MALNKNLALNDLERTKFKDGATETNSVVQTYETNEAANFVAENLLDTLQDICKTLLRIEMQISNATDEEIDDNELDLECD